MKTAVEWLANELTYKTNDGRYIVDNTDDVTDVVNKAKEMEKEQMKDAYKADLHPCSDDDAEQYYNVTFKQQEQ